MRMGRSESGGFGKGVSRNNENNETGSAGGVYVSLWEQPGGDLFYHYSQSFTGDPAYPSLAVNGGFEFVDYYGTDPVTRYPFISLRYRISEVY